MGTTCNTGSKKRQIFTRTALVAMLFTAMAALLSLGVEPAQAGQVGLSWTAPTTNTNGTPLTDLGGFKIHIGNASRSYQQHIDVGKMTNYVASNLTDGSTYYFAVTAYDTSGLESSYSNEVSKSLASTSTFTITATAGAGGSITALNNTKVSTATNSTSTISSVTVTKGASQAFSIAPASGYKVQSVAVDGTSVGAVTSYTFTNVTANHSISATFASGTTSYTITASAGSGGSISPSGATTVSGGASQAYKITPASGYSISAVTVDGASVGAVSSYTFSNVAANHTIAASFSASSTGTGSGTGTSFAVNSGGASYTSGSGVTYQGDGKYSGGTAVSTTATISGTSDAKVYQSERYGNFSYSIPVTNGNYNVTLKFAEVYFSAAGQRVFSVTANGATVISNLDIYAKAGKNAAYDVTFPVSVTNGAINLAFKATVNNAKVCGITVAPSGTTSTPTAGIVKFATNSAGSSYTSGSGTAYSADTGYTGGSTSTTTATISGTSDGKVYQSERYGNFSYSIPLANGNYSVTLKFAETYFAAAGKRVFGVKVNGASVISNLDLYAKAGKNAAYDVVLPVTVSNGTLKIDFVSQVNNAEVRGILVKTM